MDGYLNPGGETITKMEEERQGERKFFIEKMESLGLKNAPVLEEKKQKDTAVAMKNPCAQLEVEYANASAAYHIVQQNLEMAKKNLQQKEGELVAISKNIPEHIKKEAMDSLEAQAVGRSVGAALGGITGYVIARK